MRSLYRYQREHYTKITVRRELLEELRRVAGERGLSVPELIKSLLESHIGTYMGSPTGEEHPVKHLVGSSPPSVRCVAVRTGKSYLVECGDGSKAFVPSEALPELVERFGLVVEVREG